MKQRQSLISPLMAGRFLLLLATSCRAFVGPQAAFSKTTPNPTTTASRILARTILEASSSSSDHEVPTEWQGEVLQVLRTVIDPDLNQDIVTLGFVQNLKLDEKTRDVSFDVELTTPACPVKEVFKEDCKRLVEEIAWTNSAQVTMTAQEVSVDMDADTLGMNQVGSVIAVSSCKGGVGKSTTAVNLAFSLSQLGATVGIFDADFYGPSLPTMVTPDNDVVRFVGRQIAPLQRNGVRLMSFGYVNEGSAVMRGPMITQLLDQFLSVTHWGKLDYLVIDMPPGTGDIQLTLTQRLNITAAVIVTTPQELSFVDVERGVEMFDSVNVPCVAVVENMAYYEVDHSKNQPVIQEESLKKDFAAKLAENGLANGEADDLAKELVQSVLDNTKAASSEPEQIRIFGPGHKTRLSEQWGIEHTYSMPLMNQIAANGDSGTPFILEHPNSSQARIYEDLAGTVVSEVAKSKFNKDSMRPDIRFDEDEHMIKVGEEETITPANLRRGCRCASCVEEMTGRQILMATDVSENIKPMKMYPTGQYALSVDWSDGHRSLYPYRQIMSMLTESEAERNKKEVRI